QLQTDACIFVSEQPDCNGEYIVTITGSHAQVHQAQKALHSMLQESVLQVELLVPSRSIGRIIGMYSVVVAKILDEEPFQQQVAKSASFRCHRKEIIAVKKAAQKPAEERAVAQEEKLPRSQKDEVGTSKCLETGMSHESFLSLPCAVSSPSLVPSPDFNFQVDKYVDVYVSASENPQHFWIQIQGSRSSQLDKLSVEMNIPELQLPEISVGDIVAAPFPNNSTWYRAEVLKFLDNGNVDLYYVDYGDNWATTTDNLFPLRSDFLSLPFQAIECSLAGISPVGAEWTTPALDVFDEMSYCAMLKPLLAKICSFPSPGTSRYFEVQLCDPSFDPVSVDMRLRAPGIGEVLNPQPCNLSSQQEERSPASGEYGNMSFVILQALHVDI
uniref:Tudor and KH domain containing n=1 Tax=Leptobrachium leishanense TaxID=445787 RepID=A0A8C5QV40_9ANUR